MRETGNGGGLKIGSLGFMIFGVEVRRGFRVLIIGLKLKWAGLWSVQ